MHVYAVKDDLSKNLVHMHPSRQADRDGTWRDTVVFPSPGLWRVLTQATKDGVLHHLETSLVVTGEPRESAPVLPGFFPRAPGEGLDGASAA